MHTLRFPLKTGRQKEQILSKGFTAMGKLHNVVVKECKKHLRMLRRDPEYRALKKVYAVADDACRREAGTAMNALVKSYGLTEGSLHAFIRPWQARNRHLVSSHQAQEEASRVFAGVEKVLYGRGKDVHFKKAQDILTIASKSWNGLQYYDPLHTGYYKKNVSPVYPEEIFYHGEHFRVVINWNDPYVMESLDHPVRYVQIERKMFPSGWRYYVVLYLEGDAPLKHVSTEAAAGLDPGVSTEAAVFEDSCELVELAPKCKDYNKKLTRLSRQIERSIRMHNPDNYDRNGKIRKGRHKWKFTSTCRRRKRLLKTIFRQKAAYTKQSHEELAGRFVEKANVFITEEMDFAALQKRSKKPPECRQEVSAVTKKDGTVKHVHRFKKKKRFGSSIRDRAPSEFLAVLRRKCRQQGGDVITVDAKAVKASQYDHVTDSYKKVPLSCRIKTVGGHRVQRDLYSGFLLKHVTQDGRTIDRDGCITDFEAFLQAQEQCMNDIRASGAGYPACFGF